MSRYIAMMAAITMLYPASGMAKYHPTVEIDEHLTATWEACDQRFGPSPDPVAAKNWTADERQRAHDVVDCFRWLRRQLRDIPLQAIEGMIGN
jgi:hypothetical protein